MKVYRYDDCMVAEEDNSNVCIMQKEFDFYKISKDTKEQFVQESQLLSVRDVKDNFGILLVVVMTILFTLVIYFSSGMYTLVDDQIVLATFFLLINIPIHELGHIVFLKMFCKESKILAGFKFIFIYPAFYVDTSFSYFCPKYKRMCVYLAGNFMNCIFVLTIYIFCPQYLKYCYIIVSNVLVNFIPIIKSDGYYTAMTFLNRYNTDNDKKKEFVDDFIRGAIMFGIMSVLSYLF